MTSGSAAKIKADKGEQAPFSKMKQSKSVSHDKLMAIIDIGQKYFAQELERLEDLLQLVIDVRNGKFETIKVATFRANSIKVQLAMVKQLALASAGAISPKNTTESKDLAEALVNAAKEKLRAKFSSNADIRALGPEAELLNDGITPHANHGA